eukprot:g71873.t1
MVVPVFEKCRGRAKGDQMSRGRDPDQVCAICHFSTILADGQLSCNSMPEYPQIVEPTEWCTAWQPIRLRADDEVDELLRANGQRRPSQSYSSSQCLKLNINTDSRVTYKRSYLHPFAQSQCHCDLSPKGIPPEVELRFENDMETPGTSSGQRQLIGVIIRNCVESQIQTANLDQAVRLLVVPS